jgi:CRISPR-associated protein Csm2
MDTVQIPMLDEITPQELNQLAEKYAEIFVRQDRLKTHQLRNVFSSIEKMRTIYKMNNKTFPSVENDLILLKPKIAYAAGRQKSVRNNFYPFVKSAIDSVSGSSDRNKALDNFFALMESVVGYHKYFENP